jgi:hypothetical protein
MFSIFSWNSSDAKGESGAASLPSPSDASATTGVNITFVGLNSLPSSRHHCTDFACKLLWNGHWWAYILLRGDSWAAHSISTEASSDARTGIRTVITKVEKQGPYTRPYTVYLLHTKTAFSVKGAARRFREFRELVRSSHCAHRRSHALHLNVLCHRMPRYAANFQHCLNFLRPACLMRWSRKLSWSAGACCRSILMRLSTRSTFARTGTAHAAPLDHAAPLIHTQ